ncbi:MAG: hypothetical protein R3C01_14995 [Planctomycetaceae bacterium]
MLIRPVSLLAGLLLVVPAVLSPRIVVAFDDVAGVEAPAVDGARPDGEAAAAELRKLVRQLGADDFAQRKFAADRLVGLGAAAVPEVAAGVESTELETQSQCIAILKRMVEGDDPAVKGAAEEALRKLMASETASVAQLAKGALEKAQPLPQPNQAIFVRAVMQPLPFDANGKREVEVKENDRKIHISEEKEGKIVVTITKSVDGKDVVEEIKADDRRDLAKKNPEAYGLYVRHLVAGRKMVQMPIQVANGQIGGNVQIQVQMQARNVNGQRQVDINENGKKIHIEDQNGKNIQIEVTENVNGKEVVTKYAAEDLETLKKNHPEGAKVYEKYGQGNAGVQIQLGNLPAGFPVRGPRGIPIVPGGRPGVVPAQPINEQLKGALEELSVTRKALADLKGKDPVDPAKIEEVEEQLKSLEKNLFKIQAALE